MHTSTAKQRFQKFPPWRAFLKGCVFGEHFHRIDGWTAGQTGRKVSLFKQKRIRVDQRPNRKKKSTFSNKNGSVWTKDQTEGKNLPLKTKPDTCGRKINPEGQISLFKLKRIRVDARQTGGKNLPFQTKARILVDRAEVASIHELRIHSSRPNLLNGSDELTFSTKFSLLPPAFRASIPIVIFLFFSVKFWGFF